VESALAPPTPSKGLPVVETSGGLSRPVR
jgi:hypothetical protein